LRHPFTPQFQTVISERAMANSGVLSTSRNQEFVMVTGKAVAIGLVAVAGIGLIGLASKAEVHYPDEPGHGRVCREALVAVDVDRTKDSGKSWDVVDGAPEVAIGLDNTYAGVCANSYRCERTIKVRDNTPQLIILDIDFKNHDLIGKSEVSIPGTYRVGSAKVVVSCVAYVSAQSDDGAK
jgi:hypothetical protein